MLRACASTVRLAIFTVLPKTVEYYYLMVSVHALFTALCFKAGLHRNAITNVACENDVDVHVRLAIFTVLLKTVEYYYLMVSVCTSFTALCFKVGLHRNAITNAACENNVYVHVGKFVYCSAFAEAQRIDPT